MKGSGQHLATSVQLLEQAAEHAFHFLGTMCSSSVMLGSKQRQVVRQEQLVLQFASGTQGHLHEASKVSITGRVRIPPRCSILPRWSTGASD